MDCSQIHRLPSKEKLPSLSCRRTSEHTEQDSSRQNPSSPRQDSTKADPGKSTEPITEAGEVRPAAELASAEATAESPGRAAITKTVAPAATEPAAAESHDGRVQDPSTGEGGRTPEVGVQSATERGSTERPRKGVTDAENARERQGPSKQRDRILEIPAEQNHPPVSNEVRPNHPREYGAILSPQESEQDRPHSKTVPRSLLKHPSAAPDLVPQVAFERPNSQEDVEENQESRLTSMPSASRLQVTAAQPIDISSRQTSQPGTPIQTHKGRLPVSTATATRDVGSTTMPQETANPLEKENRLVDLESKLEMLLQVTVGIQQTLFEALSKGSFSPAMGTTFAQNSSRGTEETGNNEVIYDGPTDLEVPSSVLEGAGGKYYKLTNDETKE